MMKGLFFILLWEIRVAIFSGLLFIVGESVLAVIHRRRVLEGIILFLL